MTITRRRVTSTADMKALAHPVRLALLELLTVRGSMTASEAAGELGQTGANVSWHLRRLGDHGFVRQSTGGPGRRRPWKVVAESLSWGDDAGDPTLASALRDVAVDREVQLLRAATARHDAEPEPWQSATTLNQSRLWLTADEAAELGERIRELLMTKAERSDDPSARPDGARLMALMSWVVPYGPIDVTGPDAGEPRRRRRFISAASPFSSGAAVGPQPASRLPTTMKG